MLMPTRCPSGTRTPSTMRAACQLPEEQAPVIWLTCHVTNRRPGSSARSAIGRTDPQLIDDSALNFVGLDSSDAASVDDAVTASLVIPVNRPVELRLRSKDVIHNFWVPQLRFKQDLVPGMEIKVHFTANRVGKYELACAELCGQLHFKMRSYMLVLPEEEFQPLQAMPQEQFQAKVVELLNKYQLPTN